MVSLEALRHPLRRPLRDGMVVRSFTHVVSSPSAGPGGADQVGSLLGFVVEDNGQGQEAGPDLVTPFFPAVGAPAAAICAGGNDGALAFFWGVLSFEALIGNLQVRAPAD